MTVIESRTDVDALTLTFVTQFDAPRERVWQVWEDPRQLERWWGPPGWPATFETLEFTPGGAAAYYMSGPEGEKARGWWRILSIEAPSRLEFDDGFANDDGSPAPGEPTRTVITLEESSGGTRMTSVSHFTDTEQLDQLLAMGMREGMTMALEQIDAMLAE